MKKFWVEVENETVLILNGDNSSNPSDPNNITKFINRLAAFYVDKEEADLNLSVFEFPKHGVNRLRISRFG